MSKYVHYKLYNPNNNFLFDEDELNDHSFKVNDRHLDCKCVHCGKIFQISRNDYTQVIKQIKQNKEEITIRKFCSKQCRTVDSKNRSKKRCPPTNNHNWKTIQEQDIKELSEYCNLSIGEVKEQYQSVLDDYSSLYCHEAPYFTFKRIVTRMKYKGKVPQHPLFIAYLNFHNIPYNKESNVSEQEIRKLVEYTQQDYESVKKQYYEVLKVYNSTHKVTKAKSFTSIIGKTKVSNIVPNFPIMISWLEMNGLELPVFSTTSLRYDHTSWNGVEMKMRSSYEVDYAMKLDKERIEYQYEPFIIEYYDHTLKKNRRATPDFYLPKTNTIVEVKSNYTYDRELMIDRMNSFKEKGYGFQLILNFVEYDYCPIIE